MLMRFYEPQLKYGGKVFEPGIYDLSNNDYHASAGLSRSAICEFKNSPLDFWEKYINPGREQKQPTREMIIGNAVHTLILEPHLFEKEYIVKEKVDGRTKEGKEYNKQFISEANGKIIVEDDWLEQINNIINGALSHSKLMQLIKGSKKEKSIFWIDSETELLCKARPDIWQKNKLIDLKTTDDPSISGFRNSVRSYNYHIQAAMQIDAIYEVTGERIEHFILAAIPKKRPFKPFLYRLSDEDIAQGRQEYKDLLKIARACFDKDKWDLDRDYIIELPSNNFYTNKTIDNLMEVYGCNQN